MTRANQLGPTCRTTAKRMAARAYTSGVNPAPETQHHVLLALARRSRLPFEQLHGEPLYAHALRGTSTHRRTPAVSELTYKRSPTRPP